jgi:hypothetical protein
LNRGTKCYGNGDDAVGSRGRETYAEVASSGNSMWWRASSPQLRRHARGMAHVFCWSHVVHGRSACHELHRQAVCRSSFMAHVLV